MDFFIIKLIIVWQTLITDIPRIGLKCCQKLKSSYNKKSEQERRISLQEIQLLQEK